MTSRFNYSNLSQKTFQKLFELSMCAKESIDRTLQDLINIRASQINGCAFCLDMHMKEAKIHGERELRLYHTSVWRESHLFSDKERAALEWTEAVTLLHGHGISDEVYNKVREHLSEQEISDITMSICVINMWNRLNISSPNKAGSLDEMFGLNKAGLS